MKACLLRLTLLLQRLEVWRAMRVLFSSRSPERIEWACPPNVKGKVVPLGTSLLPPHGSNCVLEGEHCKDVKYGMAAAEVSMVSMRCSWCTYATVVCDDHDLSQWQRQCHCTGHSWEAIPRVKRVYHTQQTQAHIYNTTKAHKTKTT